MVSRLGKYLLLERINQGGMADVYLAKTFGFGGADQLIALKCIRPEIYADSNFIAMFIDEAKLSALLSHGNIAKTYELGRIDEAYFIAMEYVSGRDVRALVDRARARNVEIPPGLALFIVAALLEGLDYAHRKTDLKGAPLRIVHSDVSPKNVLVGYAGEVKVIDFGIARAVRQSGTQAKTARGKLGYMSPEQVRGGLIDARSDVFAVGCLFFELMTRVRLFDGQTDAVILDKVRHAEVFPPTLVTPGIPDDVEAIIMRALGREPEERYPTAEAMHREVVEVMLRRYGHAQARDLGAFVRKLFDDEHRQDLGRIERAMQIQAIPESVPAHEPSGVERTAMVNITSITPISDESTAPEGTRFAMILPSGTVVPREMSPTPTSPGIETLSRATHASLGVGVTAAPLPAGETTDVDDDAGGDTAIVRTSMLLRTAKVDMDVGDGKEQETAIVRSGVVRLAFRTSVSSPLSEDDKDATQRIERVTAPVATRDDADDDAPIEPTQVAISIADLKRQEGMDRLGNAVDETTDRLRVDDNKAAQRASAVAAGVTPEEIADESTDRVIRRKTGAVEPVPPREVTMIDKSRVTATTDEWPREARAARRSSRNRWLMIGAVVLLVLVTATALAYRRTRNRSGTGSLVIISQPLGAEVLIDGAVVGTTPFSSPRIAVGKHDVLVRDLQGRERRLQVVVTDRDVVSREVDLFR